MSTLSAADYLKAFDVQTVIASCVEKVLETRPSNPVAAISVMLKEHYDKMQADEEDAEEEQMRMALQRRLSSSDAKEAIKAANAAVKDQEIAKAEAEFEAWEEEQKQLAALGRRLSSSDTRISKAAEDEIEAIATAQVKAGK